LLVLLYMFTPSERRGTMKIAQILIQYGIYFDVKYILNYLMFNVKKKN